MRHPASLIAFAFFPASMISDCAARKMPLDDEFELLAECSLFGCGLFSQRFQDGCAHADCSRGFHWSIMVGLDIPRRKKHVNRNLLKNMMVGCIERDATEETHHRKPARKARSRPISNEHHYGESPYE